MRKPPLLGLALVFLSSAAAAQQRAPTAEELLYKRPAAAPRSSFGISADASLLLGLGVSVGVPLRNGMSSRLVYHKLKYSYDDETDSGDYDAELNLQSYGALLDYFPFGGVFRITAGLKSNGNELKLTGVANDDAEYEVGDCRYTSDTFNPLNVSGRVDFKRTAPYFGIGWGGNLAAAPGFYGVADIGVMFSGSPRTGLSASGTAVVADGQDAGCGAAGQEISTESPQFQEELRKAEAEANDDAKDYKLWPNIAIGIGYRF